VKTAQGDFCQNLTQQREFTAILILFGEQKEVSSQHPFIGSKYVINEHILGV
jgi:hypothetical protein